MIPLAPHRPQKLPIFSCSVSAGFPSPADDHLESMLDIHDFLVRRPAATFFVRATGGSMEAIGIMSGDMLVVDKSVTPIDGSVVVAAVDGECLVKIYRNDQSGIWLQAAAPGYNPMAIRDGMEFEIWGVVAGVMRKHGEDGRVCTR